MVNFRICIMVIMALLCRELLFKRKEIRLFKSDMCLSRLSQVATSVAGRFRSVCVSITNDLIPFPRAFLGLLGFVFYRRIITRLFLRTAVSRDRNGQR